MTTLELAARIDALEADEREILETLLARLEAGRDHYGPWCVDDGRDLRRETYEEVIDALHYAGAALVRAGRP